MDMLTNQEEPFDGGMERLVVMMLQDGQNNERNASNLLWWIDVCAQEVLPSIVSAVSQSFGVPDQTADNFYSEYLTLEKEVSVEVFSTCEKLMHLSNHPWSSRLPYPLSPLSQSRVVVGTGKITESSVKKENNGAPLDVQSLNLFVQSMYSANIPVVPLSLCFLSLISLG